MRVSVVIPTYNSQVFIQATIESVLSQTVVADEIIVLDDGSSDDTVSVLNAYGDRITVLQQENMGVAHARNVLCSRAQGDLIAFLDHDDIWHPNYLEMQMRLFRDYPTAVAFFTGHTNFSGMDNYQWGDNAIDSWARVECLEPLRFLKLYNSATGHFGSMSFCCIPKSILTKVGPEPFCTVVSGADDFYLFNLLPIFGCAVRNSAVLVAYRITDGAQSRDVLKLLSLSLHALELIEPRYEEMQEHGLSEAFRTAFAARMRHYAKALMSADRKRDARKQIWEALRKANNLESWGKSLAVLLITYTPASLRSQYLRTTISWGRSKGCVDI